MFGFKVIILAFSFIHFTTAQFVTKVVNGNITTTDKYPFYAFGAGCGGSIIHERYILSAAHCFYYRNASNVIYHLGRDHRANVTGSVAYQAENLFLKVNLTIGTNDDIALIKLAQPIVFNSRVQPVKLDHTYIPRFNNSFSSIGFGITETGTRSEDLRVVNLTVDRVDTYGVSTTTSNYGLGRGDSGGPAFVYTPCDGFLQFGITSTGGCSTNSTSCAVTFAYIDSENCAWLKEKSNNEIQC